LTLFSHFISVFEDFSVLKLEAACFGEVACI